MADSEFPWVGELDYGNQAAGEEPLDNVDLSSI